MYFKTGMQENSRNLPLQSLRHQPSPPANDPCDASNTTWPSSCSSRNGRSNNMCYFYVMTRWSWWDNGFKIFFWTKIESLHHRSYHCRVLGINHHNLPMIHVMHQILLGHLVVAQETEDQITCVIFMLWRVGVDGIMVLKYSFGPKLKACIIDHITAES